MHNGISCDKGYWGNDLGRTPRGVIRWGIFDVRRRGTGGPPGHHMRGELNKNDKYHMGDGK